MRSLFVVGMSILLLCCLPRVAKATEVSNSKSNTGNWHHQVVSLKQAGQVDQAIQLLQSQIQGQPKSRTAYSAQNKLVELYIEQEQFSSADVVCRQMLTDFSEEPTLPGHIYEIALLYHQKDASEQGYQLFDYLQEHWPEDRWSLRSQRERVFLLEEQNDPEAAQEALESLLTEYATHKHIADAVWEAAKFYSKRGDRDRAMQLFAYNVEHYPQTHHAMNSQIKIVKALLDEGDVEQADTAVNTLATTFSDQPTLPKELFKIARLFESLDRLDQARQLDQHIVQQYPNNPYSACSSICTALASEDAQVRSDAFGACDALKDNTEISRALLTLGKEYLGQDKTDQALRILEHSAAMTCGKEKSDMETLVQVAKLIARQGDESVLEAIVDKMINQFSHQRSLFDELIDVAGVCSEYNRISVGKTLYQYVLANCSNDKYLMVAQSGLLGIAIREGKDDGVIAALDTMCEEYQAQTDLPEVIYDVGVAYYYKGVDLEKEGDKSGANKEFSKAIVLWEELLDRFPNSKKVPETRYYIGVTCRRHLSDYEKALEYYQQVAEQWPDYEFAWSAQGMIGPCYERLIRDNKIDASDAAASIQQAYETTLDRYPGSCMARKACLSLGRIHAQQQQWEQAGDYYIRYLERYPRNKQWQNALIKLAETYEHRDDPETAVELYRSYLSETKPGQYGYQRIQDKLAKLQGGRHD